MMDFLKLFLCLSYMFAIVFSAIKFPVFCSLFLSVSPPPRYSPHRDSSTGKNMRPCAAPNTTMPRYILK